MPSVIAVEHLSKKYIISHQRQRRYTALRDVLANGAMNAFEKLCHPFADRKNDKTHEEFWALNDVSFDIREGDRVGIIGRNGAGKSTLLKILSRITEPTSGQIRIRGRVASLLEVGTGFHPELTGRENIYLNGAILGMSKSEIMRNFDEIVDFAEVEKFLDTPVKRYSSGMYVRLAFAVAAHLEPEILVVDEVLAVGDAQFQKKCLGKMSNAGKDGRTVLFVSHNMEAITSLCTKGIMLKNGSIAFSGNATDTVAYYNQAMADNYHTLDHCLQRGGSGGAHITAVKFCDENMNALSQVRSNDPGCLYLEAQLDQSLQNNKVLSVGFAIDSIDGKRLFTAVSTWTENDIVSQSETLAVICRLAYIPFVPGRYLISVSISYQGDTLDSIVHCGDFMVTDGMENLYANRAKDHGEINIPCMFKRTDISSDLATGRTDAGSI